MLALLMAFAVLALCAWRLLRNGFRNNSKLPDNPSSLKAFDAENGHSKPSRAQKLMAEAFEFIPQAPVSDAVNVLVLYATEYGFSKEVARRAASMLSQSCQYRPRVVNVMNYACVDFSREKYLLVVCSTTGDGVPPNEAEEFLDALRASSVKFHADVQYGVLALGDQSYPHFCRGGILFEELLIKVTHVVPAVHRGEVDQEDWDVILPWIQSFMTFLPDSTSRECTQNVPSSKHGIESFEDAASLESAADDPNADYLLSAIPKFAAQLEDSMTSARYSRNEPFMSRVVCRKLLTVPLSDIDVYSGEQMSVKPDDAKKVVRVEFDIANSGMQYKSGDAIGVVPRNNTLAVEDLLQALAATGDELVVPGADSLSIADTACTTPIKFRVALEEHLDLKTVRAELIEALGYATTDPKEKGMAAELLHTGELLLPLQHGGSERRSTVMFSDEGRSYVEEREVLDVLGDFVGAALTPAEIARLLRPLTARYYSISSTPVESPSSIAITVDVLRYSLLNIPREGVASTFLNDRVIPAESKVGIFVSKNDGFRLPADTKRPIIMIGPGTGVAPFVGFIEERVATNAVGRNILFFGCRHEKQDFLYRAKLEEFAKVGALDLVTAFSRDQPSKIYVQHRILERASELWDMVDKEDAHIYVCGDGSRMAPDVDRALRNVVKVQGQRSDTEAVAYLDRLAEAGRLQRDVWIP